MLFGVLFDKQRLIRGQSTANIKQLSMLITDAHRQRAEDAKASHTVIEDAELVVEGEPVAEVEGVQVDGGPARGGGGESGQ